MKQQLRNIIKLKRQNFSASDFLTQSQSVIARLESHPRFVEARVVAAFWSLPDEVDTHEFVEKWCIEKTILLPVMQSDGTLKLVRYQKGCAMNCAQFDILEPDGEEYPIPEVDLVVVPGVAFDPLGGRMGRGKGFYDRLLSDSRAFRIGVCFSYQIVERVPMHGHDVAMDAVITPEQLYQAE